MTTADIFRIHRDHNPRRLLVLRRAGADEASPIHVVLNWAETLKK